MCLFNLAGVAFYRPMEGAPAAASLAFFVVFYTLVAVTSFVVIFFFWRGRNWARCLVLATSLLALFNLSELPSAGPFQMAIIVCEAMLAVWFLYWLNTSTAKAFFKPAHNGAALPVEAG
jgi:hypothetical protein